MRELAAALKKNLETAGRVLLISALVVITVFVIFLFEPDGEQIPTPPDAPSSEVADYKALEEIPVTGDQASEVGADYTKLRDLLDKKEFGKADLETKRKILWVARREKYGWLDFGNILDFPSKDLRTINQLWLVASKGKFGFSVQKKIWIDLGGKPRQYDHNVFKRFREKVEWGENKAICFEQRAAKGHLPLGMYVIVGRDYEVGKRWESEQDKMRRKTEAQLRKQLEKLMEKENYYKRTEKLMVEKDREFMGEKDRIDTRIYSGSNDRVIYDTGWDEREIYPYFLSRRDL